MDFEVFMSVRKSHALPFISCHEFNSVHINLLLLRGCDQILCCIYHQNHSADRVMIFHFAIYLARPKFCC
jgi:hypothetical protein